MPKNRGKKNQLPGREGEKKKNTPGARGGSGFRDHDGRKSRKMPENLFCVKKNTTLFI